MGILGAIGNTFSLCPEATPKQIDIRGTSRSFGQGVPHARRSEARALLCDRVDVARTLIEILSGQEESRLSSKRAKQKAKFEAPDICYGLDAES
ncbi:hypothetical protein MRS76_19395 [Rhizobiaceae bacterium n13]|uniref:Uncharacterized protein n=1 Tax=Ferirhizobium litorale TaxID=2927786 RepID=A0AAE3QLG8_9HYPH|nr:hypothetical protein [Fererhizobium litorale]MDI7864117.1 hypothetical protein [Fererhizobium litorale]MDI7925233.1 hypothetical protein [Fererhizobium litorale]